jgi:hypothetical protein
MRLARSFATCSRLIPIEQAADDNTITFQISNDQANNRMPFAVFLRGRGFANAFTGCLPYLGPRCLLNYMSYAKV